MVKTTNLIQNILIIYLIIHQYNINQKIQLINLPHYPYTNDFQLFHISSLQSILLVFDLLLMLLYNHIF